MGAVGRHRRRDLGGHRGAWAHQHDHPAASAQVRRRDHGSIPVPHAATGGVGDPAALRRVHRHRREPPARSRRARARLVRRGAHWEPRILSPDLPQPDVPDHHHARAHRAGGVDSARDPRLRHGRRRGDLRGVRRDLLHAHAGDAEQRTTSTRCTSTPLVLGASRRQSCGVSSSDPAQSSSCCGELLRGVDGVLAAEVVGVRTGLGASS